MLLAKEMDAVSPLLDIGTRGDSSVVCVGEFLPINPAKLHCLCNWF